MNTTTLTTDTLRYATDAATIAPQIAAGHEDLSGRYGCRASMTHVTFVFCGIVHRARRFFRADMPDSGKIELYTLEPYAAGWTTSTELGWYESATSEDWVGYAAAEPKSRRDRLATMLINAAISGDQLGADQEARYAAMEMS